MKCYNFFNMSNKLSLREDKVRQMNCRSECSHRTLDLRRMALFAFYFKYVVDPRWSSVQDLTLLLTASDMDPACEASLTVCGPYGRPGLP